MIFPFKETDIGSNQYLRTFSKDTDFNDLKWHRDREDRFIWVSDTTDWQIQLDNELPKSITSEKTFIPKGVYHRLIKGCNDLILYVIKNK